eukprot:12887377-Prorocentrum_lima.AAC.1
MRASSEAEGLNFDAQQLLTEAVRHGQELSDDSGTLHSHSGHPWLSASLVTSCWTWRHTL